MKELKTIRGETIIVDDEDYEKAKQYRWTSENGRVMTRTRMSDGFIKVCSYKGLILGLEGKWTLHKNGNKLDLQKENIVVFDSNSEFNKSVVKKSFDRSKMRQGKNKKKTGKSKFFGVAFNSRSKLKPWEAAITRNRKVYALGAYAKEEYAAMAYDLKALELYGLDATRNYPLFTKEELEKKLYNIKKESKIDTSENFSRLHQGQKLNVPKTSQYIGVYFDRRRKKWKSSIRHNIKRYYVGSFFCEEDAARAYDQKAIELYGESVTLNFPLESRPGIKELKTISNETFIIDAEYYERAKQYRWRLHLHKNGKNGTIVTVPMVKDEYDKDIPYKKLILGLEGKKTVFKNENYLDLRKENLLIFDTQGEYNRYYAENYNQKRSSEKLFDKSRSRQGRGKKKLEITKYLGVQYVSKRATPWIAQIIFNKKTYHLGGYTKEEQAAMAYDIKAIELYGNDAKRNFPDLKIQTLQKKLAQSKEKSNVKYQENLSQKRQGMFFYNITKTSQYIGVSLHDIPSKKWVVRVRLQDKWHWIGTFPEEIDAAIAYDKKMIELFGIDAKRNFPHLSITQLAEINKQDLINDDILSECVPDPLKKISKKTKYLGIYAAIKKEKWRATISLNSKIYRIGTFVNEEDAARAYDKKALELYGENAKLNFPNQ